MRLRNNITYQLFVSVARFTIQDSPTFGLFEPLTFSLHKVSVVSMRADPTSNFKVYCSPLDVGRSTFIYIVHKLKHFRTLPNVIFTWLYISIFHCHVLLLTVEIDK